MSRFALALCVVLLAGCGSTVQNWNGPNPTAATVTDADAGKTVTLHVGERVEVTLHQQPGYQAWSGLDSSDHAVLQPQGDTRNSVARGVTWGTFKAVATGAADIRANAGLDCSPGMACAMLVRVWSVTVQVT
jgi:hypothetical protein